MADAVCVIFLSQDQPNFFKFFALWDKRMMGQTPKKTLIMLKHFWTKNNRDLVRVDPVIIDLVRIDLMKGSPEVSWVRLLAATGLFTFLYFCLTTSKFSLRQDALSRVHFGQYQASSISAALGWQVTLHAISVLGCVLKCSNHNFVVTVHSLTAKFIKPKHETFNDVKRGQPL